MNCNLHVYACSEVVIFFYNETLVGMKDEAYEQIFFILSVVFVLTFMKEFRH